MNEHRLREEQKRAAYKTFLSALSSGQAHAVDRFGAFIRPGGKLLYRLPHDLVFDVVNVAPVLDPNQPAGLLDVTVTCTFPIRMAANQVTMGAIVLAMQPGTASAPTPEAPPADPPSGADVPDSPEDTVARLRAVTAQGDGDHGTIELTIGPDPRD